MPSAAITHGQPPLARVSTTAPPSGPYTGRSIIAEVYGASHGPLRFEISVDVIKQRGDPPSHSLTTCPHAAVNTRPRTVRQPTPQLRNRNRIVGYTHRSVIVRITQGLTR